MPATRVTLPNGLRVMVEELPHTHSVSIGCFIGVGARYEPSALSGVSHLIEHMCFKGTRGIPNARLISNMIDGVGGVLDAATSYETTTYWTKVATMHFDRALRVITELVRYPRFDAAELEKERRVIIEEIRGLQDDPSEWVHTLLCESFWGGDQPLGCDIAGSIESVGAIQHRDMQAFWEHYYNPARMVVSMAGNVQTEYAVEAITAAFAEYPAKASQVPIPTNPAMSGPHLTFTEREIEQGNFCLGLPGLSYNDPDRRVLDVLDTVLGGNMSSRLFQEIREERGLAYDVGSYNHKYDDAGIWVLYGSVEAAALHESLDAMLNILTDLADNGITEDELQRVKEQVKGGILIALEDSWSIASRNGSLQLRYGKVIPIEQVVAEFDAVTLADVQRVARRLLTRDNLHLAVIAPGGQQDQLRAAIENWRA